MHSWTHSADASADKGPRIFVTVSRQPGAGAVSFSHRLAERLNKDGRGGWSAWDRELVEKVSSEHGIAKDLIDAIPNRHHSWLDDLLESISVGQYPPDWSEIRAYKRVIMTVRALAAAGNAIIVGRGGNFITEGLPGAIRLRLIAPLEHRIKSTAEQEKIVLHEAAARVAETDRRRAEFYRRFWPGREIVPEAFTMTLNCAELSLDEMVDCVVPLVRSRRKPAPGSCSNCENTGERAGCCDAPSPAVSAAK
jgi:cytidylate kinase